MANEIQADHTTGKTVYAQIRNTVGQIYNTAGASFEAYSTANIADYDIAMTEQGTASGLYAGSMPSVSTGFYNVVAKERAGGAPAESDVTIGEGTIIWSGSAVVNITTQVSQPGQVSPAANEHMLAMLQFLFKAWRNNSTQNATDYKLYNDDAVTVDQKASTSDDGTTFTRGEVAVGP